MSSHLQVHTLGRVKIALNGQDLTAQLPHKVKALMIYGARIGRPVSREGLADLMWPEATAESAGRSLRVALVPLRKLLDGHLDVTRDHFHVLNVELDADRFERGVRTAADSATALKQVVDLYTGDFLADFSVADSARFEDWLQSERTALRNIFVEAAGQLLDQYTVDHQFAAGIGLEARLLAADPLHEKTYRRLMHFYVANGDRTLALRLFDKLQNLLWDELGVEPEDETIHLYEQIAANLSAAAEGVMTGQSASAASLSSTVAPVHTVALQEATTVRGYVPQPLPGQVTPLFGREQEIEAVVARLRNSRLITVVGTGGVGKTRLAIAVAQRAIEDGLFTAADVVFVGLAAVRHVEQVVSVITRTFGISDTAHDEPAYIIRALLNNRRVLLIADNFEHVLDAADIVEELLREIPGLQLLVTSREPLHLYGEYCFDLAALDPADACALFTDRARAVVPNLVLDDHTLAVVDAICDRLEYQPLALELAASRARSMSLQQMLTMLDQPLHFLTTHLRGIPDRQRTVINTIEWSYNLLTADEQTLLRRLSMFVGGFSLSAVRSVAGELADLLDSLCDKSLVQRQATPHDHHRHRDSSVGVRYNILETIRQYAHDQLTRHDEVTEAESTHTRYFVQFAEHTDRLARDHDADLCWSQLEADLGNLRFALERSASDPHYAPDEYLLIGALGEFWYRNSYHREASDYSRMALERRDLVSPSLLAGVLFTYGIAAHGLGDRALADAVQKEALNLYQQSGDDYRVGQIRFYQSMRARTVPEGLALAQESLRLAHKLNDMWLIALASTNVGILLTLSGQPEHAVILLQGVDSTRARLDTYTAAYTLLALAYARSEIGQMQTALQDRLEALHLIQAKPSPMITLIFAELSDAYLALNNLPEAWRCYLEGVRLAEERQDLRRLRRLYRIGAMIAARNGDEETMRTLYSAALTDLDIGLLNTGDFLYTLIGLSSIALLLAQRGHMVSAAALSGMITRLLSERDAHPLTMLRESQEQVTALLGGMSRYEQECAERLGESVALSDCPAFALEAILQS